MAHVPEHEVVEDTSVAAPAPLEPPVAAAPAPAAPTQAPAPLEPRTEAEILAETKKGLASFTAKDDPLTSIARARGTNLAASYGLGPSSFSSRAAESAVLDYAAPLVTGAAERASQERQTAAALQAQSLEGLAGRESAERIATEGVTSREAISGAQIGSSESMQIKDIEANAEALGRELTSAEKIERDKLQTAIDMQETALGSEASLQFNDLKNKRDMQGIALSHDESMQVNEFENKISMQQYELSAADIRLATELASREKLLGVQLTATEKMQLADFQHKEEMFKLASDADIELQKDRQAFESDEADKQIFADLLIQKVEIGAREDLQEAMNAHNIATQGIDILYRVGLEKMQEKHEVLLANDRQAAVVYSDMIRQETDIYNNPDTSTAQKDAAIFELRETTADFFDLMTELDDVDIRVEDPRGVAATTGDKTADTGTTKRAFRL